MRIILRKTLLDEDYIKEDNAGWQLYWVKMMLYEDDTG